MTACRESCEIETVDGMTCRVDCFRPKVVRRLVFIKHGSCGFYESSILPFHYTVLLRSIWSGELMLDSFLVKKFFNVGILELGAIITSYVLDLYFKFILNSLNELLHDSLCFTFT